MGRKTVWLVAGLLVSAAACGGAGKAKPERVLAVVDGDRITETMLMKEAETLPPYVRPILETPSGKVQFLESLITRDLLMREALRRGIERRPEVRDRLSQARRSVVIEALLRDVVENAPGLSEEALRKHYEENRASYETGERVQVSHVLYKDPDAARRALGRARAGEPFPAIMKEATEEGGTAADLGFIERGSFVEEFEEAAFRAEPGQVVGPVKTMYGYHVIRVEERKPAGTIPFEEARPKIAAELRETAQREAFDAFVAGLRKRADVRLAEGLPASAGPPEKAPGESPPSPGGVPGK